jgi:hypothetical protein
MILPLNSKIIYKSFLFLYGLFYMSKAPEEGSFLKGALQVKC